MESTKVNLPNKRSVPAAHRDKPAGYSGISLSPPVQKKKNETGLPDQLKVGAETLSDISLDDVKVHYNSSKPAQLNAHAYAQGTEIHLGSGQEKHLPHETWHVVQQKQGRVKPTDNIGGQPVNDSPRLEKEADRMGSKISGMDFSPPTKQLMSMQLAVNGTVQRIGDEQLEAMQDQGVPEIPNRDEERAAAREAANSLILKSSTTVLLIENLVGLIDDIPLKTSRTANAVAQATGAVSEIRSELEVIAGAGIEAAMAISNTPDSEMDAVINTRMNDVVSAEAMIAESLSLLADYANPAAHIAAEAGAAGLAAEIISIADEAKAESNTHRVRTLLDANANARGRKRDKASTVLDVADTLNNVGGTAAGTAGIVEVAGVAGAGGGAVVAAVGGALGILFGSIGVVLGLYGLFSGKIQKKRLNSISPAIQDADMLETLRYAESQTDTSISRSKLVIGAGAAAIAAGTLGLIAISVLSLGATAAVAGIAAALLGLGIVAFKYFHSRSKRKAERIGLAQAIVREIETDGPHKFKAIAIITKYGLNPEDAQKTQADRDKLVDNLAGQVGDLVKSRRKQMAEGILDALVNGKPSKQFQAELIIKALGREPGKARSRIKNGDTATEVSRIMAKLSSW